MRSGIFNMYPLLETDVYKTVHHAQYPEDMSYLTSYFIPRKSRTDEDFLIDFGLQYYIKKYLLMIGMRTSLQFRLKKHSAVQIYNAMFAWYKICRCKKV